MSLYRKKPIVVHATQWFRNGDHPNDYVGEPLTDSTRSTHHDNENRMDSRGRRIIWRDLESDNGLQSAQSRLRPLPSPRNLGITSRHVMGTDR